MALGLLPEDFSARMAAESLGVSERGVRDVMKKLSLPLVRNDGSYGSVEWAREQWLGGGDATEMLGRINAQHARDAKYRGEDRQSRSLKWTKVVIAMCEKVGWELTSDFLDKWMVTDDLRILDWRHLRKLTETAGMDLDLSSIEADHE